MTTGGLTDRISIRGIEATGFHGVFDFEKREGQTFRVDVDLDLRPGAIARAAESDDLALTVDYGAVAEAVCDQITGEALDLIETLAWRIAGACLGNPLVVRVTATVHKPQAPITVPFEDVSVTVVRDRP